MKTYTRPVRWNWWTRNPYYVWYMLREASCVFITVYALILLVGLARLAQGEAAFESWRLALAHPGAVAFHVIALVLVLYHSWTWFKVMPKTLPRVPLSDAVIVAGGAGGAIVLSVLLFAAVYAL